IPESIFSLLNFKTTNVQIFVFVAKVADCQRIFLHGMIHPILRQANFRNFAHPKNTYRYKISTPHSTAPRNMHPTSTTSFR
ncbi:MAG TPA: hypothetical protein PK041_09630, partial [Kaistella sp.]|nr:hypothetical protein [Kaistella sp.]